MHVLMGIYIQHLPVSLILPGIARTLGLNKTWISVYRRKCQSDIFDAMLGVTVIHLIHKLLKGLLIFDQ